MMISITFFEIILWAETEGCSALRLSSFVFSLAFIKFVHLVWYVQDFVPYHNQVSYFCTILLNGHSGCITSVFEL